MLKNCEWHLPTIAKSSRKVKWRRSTPTGFIKKPYRDRIRRGVHNFSHSCMNSSLKNKTSVYVSIVQYLRLVIAKITKCSLLISHHTAITCQLKIRHYIWHTFRPIISGKNSIRHYYAAPSNTTQTQHKKKYNIFAC